jgi:hypothetical protein
MDARRMIGILDERSDVTIRALKHGGQIAYGGAESLLGIKTLLQTLPVALNVGFDPAK